MELQRLREALDREGSKVLARPARQEVGERHRRDRREQDPVAEVAGGEEEARAPGSAPRIGSPSGVAGRRPDQAVTNRAEPISGQQAHRRGDQALAPPPPSPPCGIRRARPSSRGARCRPPAERGRRRREDRIVGSGRPASRSSTIWPRTGSTGTGRGREESNAAQAPAASTTAPARIVPARVSTPRQAPPSMRKPRTVDTRPHADSPPLGAEPCRAGQPARIDRALVRKETRRPKPPDERRSAISCGSSPGRSAATSSPASRCQAIRSRAAFRPGAREVAVQQTRAAIARRRRPSPPRGRAPRPGRARGSRGRDRRTASRVRASACGESIPAAAPDASAPGSARSSTITPRPRAASSRGERAADHAPADDEDVGPFRAHRESRTGRRIRCRPRNTSCANRPMAMAAP